MLAHTMKRCTLLSATIWAMASCASLQAQSDSNAATPQKQAVTKLDGTKYFGFVEVTDDYTIRISNDAGITRLPIAELGDADFQKYGFQKDRSKDGRFWYERKEALKDSTESTQPAPTNASEDPKAPIEIRLSEISALQPLISAYEKTLAPKKSEQPTTPSEPEMRPDSSDEPFRPMFSEPGLGGPLPQPFSSGAPPLQSLSGFQPSLPASGPTIPSMSGTSGLPAPTSGVPPPR